MLAGLLAVLAGGVAMSTAGAAGKDAHGWWWRAETGLLGAPVPPPGVPEDGLAVETTPDGPSAISALRYTLAADEAQPALLLTVVDQQGDVAIQACTATQAWKPTHGGSWDQRPTYDCGTAVDGEPSQDGQRWRWELDPLLRKDRLDIVLVPAPGLGRVTFAEPDDAALQTRSEDSGDRSFEAPPVASDPAGSGTTSPGEDSSAAAAGGPSGTDATAFTPQDAGGTAAAAQPPAVTPGMPEQPLAAAPAQPGAAGSTAPPAAAGSDQSRTVGAIVAALAVLLGLTLWRRDAAAGAATEAATQQVRGLGRFARPRVGVPRAIR
jgi:hypothetical protein